MLRICILIELIFCFAQDVLFAFMCMFLFHFIFSYFHRWCLCFPPSSVLSAHLRALAGRFVVN
jgi:hypothetical protein